MQVESFFAIIIAMIKNQIVEALTIAVKKLGVIDEPISLERPTNIDFGDYTSNIAMKLAKRLKANPFDLANKIINNLPKINGVTNVIVVKPGFINFIFDQKFIIDGITELIKKNLTIEPYYFGTNKKVIVEFAHPNTHKIFHIGHLRNISTGEAIARIIEFCGNQVVRANYQGDIGLHIAKALWGIKQYLAGENADDIERVSFSRKIKLLGEAYTQGTKAYESDDTAKNEILKINAMIYEKNPEIIALWKKTRQWSLDYYDSVYKRVETKFDRLFFESEMALRAKEIIEKLLSDKILEHSEGAVVFNGKKYGLDIRVFLNSQGFPTYEGKELALAEKEFSEFGEIDKCIHIVTPEQTSFFKVTFKVEELLDKNKYSNKQSHLSYGWVKLKTGVMSSREGNVIEGPWLMDEVKKKIVSKFNCSQDVAEVLAIGSIKYSFLKNNLQATIAFDLDESISIEGNSCPYLIYTYVRTRGILNKETALDHIVEHQPLPDEVKLLRLISCFPDTIIKSAQNLSPNYIANYLYQIAQEYNFFYQKYPILKADKNKKQLRLIITQAVNVIISKGLYLLGIKTVEKM